MAPTIHCVRHAQGFHNVGPGDYTLPDPRLTPLGEKQCEALRKASFADQSKISLVAASPLCRTLHTAATVFSPAFASKGHCAPAILALPDAQEISDDRCDTGSDPDVLRGIAAENGWPVDFSLVHEGWNNKSLKGRYSPHNDAIQARAHNARLLLRQKIRDLVSEGDVDAQVVLITHGGFLHYFTDDWEDSYAYPGTGWRNCETRSYTFEHDFKADADTEARLVETEESRLRRGKLSPMLRRDQQAELYKMGLEGWGSQGLQRPDLVGTAAIDVSA